MQQKKTEIIKCFLCSPCGPVSIDRRTGVGTTDIEQTIELSNVTIVVKPCNKFYEALLL